MPVQYKNPTGGPPSPQPAATVGTQTGAPSKTQILKDTGTQVATNAAVNYLTGGAGLPGIAAGGGGPIGASGDFTPSNVVNTHPIGINLGAIMQPFNTGSPQNGGMPASIDSPWGATIKTKTTRPAIPPAVAIIAAAGLGLVVLIRVLRRQ